jgi:hypothetical protein
MATTTAGQETLEQQLASTKKELAAQVRMNSHLEKQLTQKANQVATLKSQHNDSEHLEAIHGEVQSLKQGMVAVIKSVAIGQSPSNTELQAIMQRLEAVSAPPKPAGTDSPGLPKDEKPGVKSPDDDDTDPAYVEMFEKAYAAGYSPEHPLLKKSLYESDGKTLRKPLEALTAFEAALEADNADTGRIQGVQAEAARKTGLPPTPPAGLVANAGDWRDKPTTQKIADGLAEAFQKVTGGRKNTED